MDFSLQLLPEQPLAELIGVIRLADDLGFRGCYSADETYHKDMWILFGAAAPRTRRIRFGPEVSGVILRDPGSSSGTGSTTQRSALSSTPSPAAMSSAPWS
jgi:5,10-methylenetetrahydromethanopterin reductase